MNDEERDVNVLVVTSQREWEVIEPLRAIDAPISTIVVDPSLDPIRRFVSTYRRCVSELAGDVDVILLDVFDVPGFAVWCAARRHETPIVSRLVGDRLGELKRDKLRRPIELGNYAKLPQYLAMYRLSGYVVEHSDGAIVVSTDLERKLARQTDLSLREIGVVPVPFRDEFVDPEGDPASTIEAPEPSASKAIDVPTDGEVVVTITNLKYSSKLRGVQRSLDAMVPVLQERPNAYYIIVGGGPLLFALREHLERAVPAEIQDRVIVTGYVDDVRVFYDRADLLLYVSHLDGYPNVVLEAQAMGVPVIANDDFGMTEQIDHAETGLLVDATRTDQITDEIDGLLRRKHERERLGENARKTVLERNAECRIGRELYENIERIYRCLEVREQR